MLKPCRTFQEIENVREQTANMFGIIKWFFSYDMFTSKFIPIWTQKRTLKKISSFFFYFLPGRYKSVIFRAQTQLGNPYRSWQVFDNLKLHWKLSNFWFSNIKPNSQFLKLRLHDFWLIAGICENYLCNEPFFTCTYQ